MNKNKQEEGVTLIGTAVAIIIVLLFTGVNLTKNNDGTLRLSTGILEEYNVSVIAEEVELAMGELQMEYYYEKYVNNDLNDMDTFGEYIAQKLQEGGIITSKGKVTSAEASTIVYEDKQENKIAKGTFSEATGEINITSLITENLTIEE